MVGSPAYENSDFAAHHDQIVIVISPSRQAARQGCCSRVPPFLREERTLSKSGYNGAAAPLLKLPTGLQRDNLRYAEGAYRIADSDVWETKHLGRQRNPGSVQKKSIQHALARMDEAIKHCEAALASANLVKMHREIRSAKKSYAVALKTAWRFALTEQNVQNLESRSVRLEKAIAELEARCAALQVSSEARGVEGKGDRRR
jgi:hypothetical protein